LDVADLTHGSKVKQVSFQVRSGEIVGIAGLVGAGKTELSRLLFAADRRDSGEIRLKGKLLSCKQPQDAIREGIVLVPEERRKQGILVEESVRDNLTLPSLANFASFGFVRRKKETSHAQAVADKLGVKTPNVLQKVGLLS